MSLGYPIQDIHDEFAKVEGAIQNAFEYIESAYLLDTWQAARADVRACIGCLASALRYLRGADANPPYDWDVIVGFAWLKARIEAIPECEEYELTWKKICEAWAKDDFEGKEWTIACIDHMRKLMWDKPFRIVWASKPATE